VAVVARCSGAGLGKCSSPRCGLARVNSMTTTTAPRQSAPAQRRSRPESGSLSKIVFVSLSGPLGTWEASARREAGGIGMLPEQHLPKHRPTVRYVPGTIGRTATSINCRFASTRS
jgi:hypothetical protein